MLSRSVVEGVEEGMEGWAKSTPSFDGTRDDVSAPCWRVPLMFVKFAKIGCNARCLIGAPSVSSNRVAHGGVKNVFGR